MYSVRRHIVGVINTPQVLMLSGLGYQAELQCSGYRLCSIFQG
jgi:hypothetical protein